MRNIGVVLVVALAWACGSAPAAAQQDPNRTATVYVHGFESSGADRQGTYGETIHPDGVDSIAARAGLQVANGAASLPPKRGGGGGLLR
jgi:hypothetical protein